MVGKMIFAIKGNLAQKTAGNLMETMPMAKIKQKELVRAAVITSGHLIYNDLSDLQRLSEVGSIVTGRPTGFDSPLSASKQIVRLLGINGKFPVLTRIAENSKDFFTKERDLGEEQEFFNNQLILFEQSKYAKTSQLVQKLKTLKMKLGLYFNPDYSPSVEVAKVKPIDM